jgi:predicted dehydrogenase
LQAFGSGARVFCEKPLADTLEAARRVVSAANAAGRVLLIGYILRLHPSWSRFVEIGRTLGKPLVMRMNLNQQSAGSFWEVHKKLIDRLRPSSIDYVVTLGAPFAPVLGSFPEG